MWCMCLMVCVCSGVVYACHSVCIVCVWSVCSVCVVCVVCTVCGFV